MDSAVICHVALDGVQRGGDVTGMQALAAGDDRKGLAATVALIEEAPSAAEHARHAATYGSKQRAHVGDGTAGVGYAVGGLQRLGAVTVPAVDIVAVDILKLGGNEKILTIITHIPAGGYGVMHLDYGVRKNVVKNLWIIRHVFTQRAPQLALMGDHEP